MKILRIKSLECGYKFTCEYNTKIFNFTLYPECCPLYYDKQQFHYSIDNIGQNIHNINNLIKEVLSDKILNWMNETKYDPHDYDKSRY